MATKTWSLYASDGPFQYQQYSLEQSPELTAKARRLTGGLGDGVDLLCVSNGPLEINLLPTRGMGVWNMSYEGESIGWKSPIAGPVHPSLVHLGEPSGLGWLDGFDEFIVRCGMESNGAPDFDEAGSLRYPLHGRIANRPAKQVDVTIDSDTEQITVRGVVEETRFHFSKLRLTSTLTLQKGESGFELVDTIENYSGRDASCQMLYHINVGEPLLDAGSQILAPAEIVAPWTDAAGQAIENWDRMQPPGTSDELVYFFKLLANADGQCPIMMHNAAGDKGLQVTYHADTLPCFTLWKNPVPSADGYVIGLEPATNYPNPRTYEQQQGRVVTLEPGASVDMKMRVEYLPTSEAVGSASDTIGALQSQATPGIHTDPRVGWKFEG